MYKGCAIRNSFHFLLLNLKVHLFKFVFNFILSSQFPSVLSRSYFIWTFFFLMIRTVMKVSPIIARVDPITTYTKKSIWSPICRSCFWKKDLNKNQNKDKNVCFKKRIGFLRKIDCMCHIFHNNNALLFYLSAKS